MKRTFLYATAILFVCAIALLVITTHVFQPHAATPTFGRIFSHFAP